MQMKRSFSLVEILITISILTILYTLLSYKSDVVRFDSTYTTSLSLEDIINILNEKSKSNDIRFICLKNKDCEDVNKSIILKGDKILEDIFFEYDQNFFYINQFDKSIKKFSTLQEYTEYEKRLYTEVIESVF
jgi:hypothetical protein